MYIFVCHFSIPDRAHGPLQVSIYTHNKPPKKNNNKNKKIMKSMHKLKKQNKHTVLATTTHNYTRHVMSHRLSLFSLGFIFNTG